MTKYRNHLLLIFLLLYTFIGIYLSVTNGISHDEFHEQLNWEVNLSSIKSFFANGNINELLNYNDKYHGIGFHLLSQPVQKLLNEFISNYNEVSSYGGYLISKHPVIFILFSISSIFFYLLCLKVSKNINFSIFSSLIYLFYPYLFGHAQINPKDVPFLSIWIINSYFFLTIIESLFYEKEILKRKIILCSFFSAYLISIRISGLIVFVEFIIAFIILFNIKKINLISFLKKNYLTFIHFFIFLLFFIYILNPIFWTNPLEIIKSIEWMSKYYNDVCTNTLGKCLRALNLPSSYVFIWFFFKLPILVILGFVFFPFVEQNIFKEKIISIYYGTFLFTVLSILIIFILKNVALYDEIRHIMFLIPMIIIVSLTNIFYFNNKLFYSLSAITIIFFVLENFSINPYQYTWLNSFAKVTDIEKNFEIDYWGISNKNLQKKIIKYAEINSINSSACVYGDLYTKEFLLKKDFKCFKNYSELDAAKERPFYVYKNVRNVKRSNPKDCNLIWNETYKYILSNKEISVGTVWYCD